MPVRKTTREFKLDIEKFARQVEMDYGDAKREISMRVFRGIIKRTPVDKGRLWQSWFMSDNSPSNKVAPEMEQPDSRQPFVDPDKIETDWGNPFAETYIVNNLPYAIPIEFEGHSATKAPLGMVRVTIAEVASGIET